MNFKKNFQENFGRKYDVGPEESADRPFGWVLMSTNSIKSWCTVVFAKLDTLPAFPCLSHRTRTWIIVDGSSDLYNLLKDMSKCEGMRTKAPRPCFSMSDFAISTMGCCDWRHLMLHCYLWKFQKWIHSQQYINNFQGYIFCLNHSFWIH